MCLTEKYKKFTMYSLIQNIMEVLTSVILYGAIVSSKQPMQFPFCSCRPNLSAHDKLNASDNMEELF
jgi:hypothetical protein